MALLFLEIKAVLVLIQLYKIQKLFIAKFFFYKFLDHILPTLPKKHSLKSFLRSRKYKFQDLCFTLTRSYSISSNVNVVGNASALGDASSMIYHSQCSLFLEPFKAKVEGELESSRAEPGMIQGRRGGLESKFLQ